MSGFDLRGLIENSLLEWENHVAAVAIAGGCNLRCPFCHSWRYVTGLDELERLDPELLFRLLARQKGWIDGVVFTGGEPTLQPDLADMIRKTREYGVKIKLHTNGTRPEVIRGLLDEGLLDCLALDYKAPLDERFFAAAGLAADPGALQLAADPKALPAVRESFRLAAASGVDREYHTTLVPRFVDEKALEDMAAGLEPEGLWFLQQFESDDCLDPDPYLSGIGRYGESELEALAAIAWRQHGRVLLKKGKTA